MYSRDGRQHQRPIEAASRKSWCWPALVEASAAMCVAVLVFGWFMRLPFVQDDWGWLEFAATHSLPTALSTYFHGGASVLFRPLGETYLLGMFRIFGPQPFAFHIVALCIHATNASLVSVLITHITRDRLIGILSGLVYASAIAVHLDALIWAVGIFDLGGTLCFLLSLFLLCRSYGLAAALVYVAGCLVKESVLVLPVLLIAISLIDAWRSSRDPIFPKNPGTLAPLLIAFSALVILRGMSPSPLNLPPTHPYVIRLFGIHVLKHLLEYPGYMFQAFFPFYYVRQRSFQITFAAAAIVLLYGATLLRYSSSARYRSNAVAFLSCWVVVGLLPVLFLPNHTYRYYAMISLGPFVALVLILAKGVFDSVFGPRWSSIRIAVLSILAIANSALQAHDIYQEGTAQRTLSDGTNLLVERAFAVNAVRAGLMTELPMPAPGTVIILDGVNVWAIGKDSGPRFWYRDPTIRVYAADNVRSLSDRLYVDNPKEDQLETVVSKADRRIWLDDRRVRAFRLNGVHLMPLNILELARR